MRESILKELYFGGISPWERGRLHTPEYKELSAQISGIEDHFKAVLSPEEYMKFEKLQNLWAQANIKESTDLFEYSFCLGALTMMEVFSWKEK